MSDKAHNWTDKELKRMERHLTEIYTRANEDLKAKADKYFEQFDNLDKKKRALVEAGKMSEDDYETWRQNKIMTGKHWTAMKEQVAQELANVDKTALDYVNGRLPEVYAVNYNAVGDAIESRVKGYSFELVDASTVKRLATADRKLLPYKELDIAKDKRWNMRMFQSEVLQGIVQGESMGKIANRIFPEIMSKTDLTGKSAAEIKGLTKRARDAAIRNARTMVTGAENMGRLDMLRNAQDKGVIAHKVWMATPDNRTRDSHRHIDGEEVESDGEFSNGLQCPGDPDGDPAEVFNCRCTLGYKVVGFGEVTSIENVQEQATDRESAYRVLTEDVGFYEVSDSLKYIDDETIVAQANQLSLLNRKFHAIGDDYGGYVGAENSKSFVATTRGSFTNPNNQSLVFSFNSYAHGYDKVIDEIRRDILSGWSMPALEDKYGVYTVTHEYGHILQNVLMNRRIDMDEYNASREKIGFNVKKLNNFKKKTGDAAAKDIFSEILGIAKENNPDFSIRANLSEYGRSNYQEAFAEAFANGQLGKPNELGNAMNEWLRRQGFK